MSINTLKNDVEAGEIITPQPGPSILIKTERQDDDDHESSENPHPSNTFMSQPGPSIQQIKVERKDNDANIIAEDNGTNFVLADNDSSENQQSSDTSNKRPLESSDNESTLSNKRKKSESLDNPLSFKVYLFENDTQKEVHKFRVDQDLSFTSLREKITATCPVLEGKLFALTWKDEDGDEIVVATDEALNIAITEQSHIKKLYAKYDAAAQDSTQKDSSHKCSAYQVDVIHEGIFCDGCDTLNFQGLRYKCVICEDYDLCSECVAKDMHLHHSMIRLTKSLRPGMKLETMIKALKLKPEKRRKRATPRKPRAHARKLSAAQTVSGRAQGGVHDIKPNLN